MKEKWKAPGEYYYVLHVHNIWSTLSLNHTLSPVEIFDLPSASLADNEPIPKDGSTAKHQ